MPFKLKNKKSSEFANPQKALRTLPITLCQRKIIFNLSILKNLMKCND